jgi:DNA polymerase III subunit delta'
MTGDAIPPATPATDHLVEQVFEEIRKTWASGRLAHAYLIHGPPRGAAADLAMRMVQLVMCTAPDPPCGACPTCQQLAAGRHFDLHWLEPRSRSRQIVIEEIRDLNRIIATTSYCGGWKAAIIRYADRMNENAANAFLKTLEEPPPRTLLLLLSETGQMLLPTIRSRCQHLVVGTGACVPDEPWVAEVLDVLRIGAPRSALDAMTHAARLAGSLREVEAELTEEVTAELRSLSGEVRDGDEADRELEADIVKARVEARLKEFRESLLRVMTYWFRDVLLCASGGGGAGYLFPADRPAIEDQARILGRAGALQTLEAIEQCARRLADNFSPTQAFEAFFRQLGRARTHPDSVAPRRKFA